MNRRDMIRVTLTTLAAIPLASCAPAAKTGAAQDDIQGMKLAPLSDLPDEVRKTSASVQQAYRFAVANPEVLKQVPCYCGCGSMGHTSNYSCYVKSDTGKIVFDTHAIGCSICVDITHDTARMLGQGKTIQQIKAEIDRTYSQYGPSNME